MTDVMNRLGDDGDRAHVVLTPLATAQARVMAGRLRITIPELVRRSLGLYRMWLTLPDGDELMIKRKSGSLERLVLERGPQ